MRSSLLALVAACSPGGNLGRVEQLTAGVATDSFGQSVAVSGDTVVAGSRGAVWVFVEDESGWVGPEQLTSSDAGPNEEFGISVSLSDDTLLVGGWGLVDAFDKSPPTVFVRTGDTWAEQQALAASDATVDDSLGWSVAVDGDTAVVGAPFAAGTGVAYVFVRTDGVWTQQQRLVGSDVQANAWFGHSVAVSGDTAFVGTLASGAYVFAREAGAWTEQVKLDDGRVGYGRSVSVSGDTAWVTSSNGSPGHGEVTVFARTGSGWSPERRFEAGVGVPPSSGNGWDGFGWAVAGSGDVAVVGMPYTCNACDKAFFYARRDGEWTERKRLDGGPETYDGSFGEAVAISERTLVIGAPVLDLGDGDIWGAIWVYPVQTP